MAPVFRVAAFVGAAFGGAAAADNPWYPYSGETWGFEAEVCRQGSQQSPVDFPADCTVPMPAPAISWATQPVTLTNNGHTVQLSVAADSSPSSTMEFQIFGQTKSYTLVQCHFHWGSEHTVAGSQYPFEAHCVHTTSGGRYGVFGLFFEVGAASPFLAQFEDSLPAAPGSGSRRLGEKRPSTDLFGSPVPGRAARRLADSVATSSYTGPVNFTKLYDGVNLTKYYHYDGSFTTPPCTEAVDFYIMRDVATMSAQQLEKFKAAIGWEAANGNFRPPQPLMGRPVYGCGPNTAQPAAWYPYNANAWSRTVGLSANEICRDGTMQSPINFEACSVPESRVPIEVSWLAQQVELTNNGHTVQLKALNPVPGKMMVNGSSYTLVQCHFHWSSEHTVSDAQYPFEAHCVHSKDGAANRYGVFGVFYEVATSFYEPNAFLQQFEDQLPASPSPETASTRRLAFDVMGNPMGAEGRRLADGVTLSQYTGPLNFTKLYGDNDLTNYWDYQGSFTTPPCTEAVDFFIMMRPEKMTQAQLDKFKAAMDVGADTGNFRPPQPLNGRVVSGCSVTSNGSNPDDGAVVTGGAFAPRAVLPLLVAPLLAVRAMW